MGDSNINLLEYGKSDQATHLTDTLTEHGFAPLISRPTRVTDHSTTLIDHIFTNDYVSVTKTGVISDFDISDHLATFVRFTHRIPRLNEPARPIRIINSENVANFRTAIENLDWSYIYSLENAVNIYESIAKKYYEVYEKHFPIQSISQKRRRSNPSPWQMDWLKCACDRKNSLYRNFIKHPSTENKIKYTKLKKFVLKHTTLAKKNYYCNYFQEHIANSKKQWAMINSLLFRTPKHRTNIGRLEYNGRNYSSTKDIAESFNDYFVNIAQKLKDQSGSPSVSSHPGLPKLTRCQKNMPPATVTYEDVASVIKSLKPKATSDTCIKPLKEVSHIMSGLLTHAISKSLEQGLVPDGIKIAKVVPLHKSGSKIDIKNYRPISLLPTFSKIYEKIMQSRLVEHLKSEGIIFKAQYGFRSGHSCEHAVLDVQNNIIKSLERKQVAALLLLDFSKAFDMVDHDILLVKLEHYGIRGSNLDWFRTYLKDRTQYVHVNDYSSERKTIAHGVPQGSVLGPTLFLLYINDLPLSTKLAEFFIFADDSNLLITASSCTELEEKCNIVLHAVQSWVTQNGLKLNIDKTNLLVYNNNTNQRKAQISVSLNGTPVVQKNEAKFLGVVIDTNLNWKSHLVALSSKISRNAGILYRLRKIVPVQTLKSIYCSFVESHLIYCASVWGAVPHSRMTNVFAAQKKAVRALGGAHTNLFFNKETGEVPRHTKPIFEKYSLLALPNLIAKSLLCQTHKIRLGVAPENIANLMNLNRPSSHLRTTRQTNKYIFSVPSHRLTRSDYQLAYIGPKIYNHVYNMSEKTKSTDDKHWKNICDKFYDPFKKSISKFLLQIQSEPNKINPLTWEQNNFVLQQIKQTVL